MLVVDDSGARPGKGNRTDSKTIPMLLHYGSWQKGIDMKLQESTTEAVAATREQRAKAAGRRYRRQQSAFDILIIFLIAGEFDLSVGANFIFSSILMAQLNTNGLSVWLAALIGLAVGTGIGLLNGVITLRLGIPSFITTLGTMLIWQAGTLFVHGASSQPFSPSPGFAALTAGNLGVFPADFLWFVVLAIAFWALLQRNRIGNHIFAAGGNKQAATATGVRVDRTKLIAFSLAGACAALGGILSASQIGNIAPSTGDVLPLQAIAACVIGGLALTGGRGTILGIVLGSALIYWISDVLLLIGAPGFYITAPVGILIIAAAAIYEILRARRA